MVPLNGSVKLASKRWEVKPKPVSPLNFRIASVGPKELVGGGGGGGGGGGVGYWGVIIKGI